MRFRSPLAALAASLAVVSSLVIGGAAQATPPTSAVPCSIIVAGSVSPSTNAGYSCTPHEGAFDPLPNETSGNYINDSTMTESGDRMAFVRTAPNSVDCQSSAGQNGLMLFIGAFRTPATQWVQAPLQNVNCKQLTSDSIHVTLNSTGTAGLVAFGTIESAADNAPAETDRYSYVLPFTVNASLQVTWGALHQVASCLHSEGCISIFTTRLHSSLSGDAVASAVKFFTAVTDSPTEVSYFNASTNQWMTQTLSDQFVFDSGISRDGKVMYTTGVKSLSGTGNPVKLVVSYCRAPFSNTCLSSGQISWTGVSNYGVSGSAAINDNGSQLALSWVSLMNNQSVGGTTSLPIPATAVNTEVSPNVRILPAASMWLPRNTPITHISPDGKRMWASGVAFDNTKIFIQTAAISGYNLTWNEPFASPSVGSNLAYTHFGLSISRNGRLSAMVSDPISGNVAIYQAEKADRQSKWWSAPITRARDTDSRSVTLSTNALGTRWISSGALRDGSAQATVSTGTFRAIPAATVAPKITGVVSALKTLAVNTGTWSTAGGSFTYLWRQDGTPMNNGVTGPTQYLPESTVGHRISVDVIFHKSGYYDRSVTTAATAVVTGQSSISFGLSGATGVAGAPQVGDTISGDFQHAPVPASANLVYVWKVGSRTLPADTASYTPTVNDIGKTISLTVNVSSPNWKSASITVVSKKIVSRPACGQAVVIAYC